MWQINRAMNYVSYLRHCPGYPHTPFPWQRYILSRSSPLDRHSAIRSDQEYTCHFHNRDLGSHLLKKKRKSEKRNNRWGVFFSLPVKLQLFNDILQSLLPKKESNTAPLHDIHTLGWIWKNTCTYPYLYLPRNHLSLRSEDFFSVQLFVHRQKWINV